MPLETATYINGLVSSNPAGTDSEGQGDDHLRLIKATLLATFPNITGAMTATQAVLNALTLSHNALRFNGAVPLGSMHQFPADPGTTLVARGGTATGTEQYIECDGSTYPIATFPDLGASPFVTVVTTNFTVPNLKDTGRFMRSRSASTTIGTTQANQNVSHNHTATVTDPGHTHVNTLNDPGHAHGISDPGHNHTYVGFGAGGTGTNANSAATSGTAAVTGTNSTGITVNGGSTGVTITNASHTTGVTVANTAVGGTEARPEAFITMVALKT